MKRVYLAGPIKKGDLLHNIEQADKAFADLLRGGVAPWVPHWSCYHGSGRWVGDDNMGFPKQVIAVANPAAGGFGSKLWVDMDLAWVEVAEAILRLPGESVGADREVEHAKKHGVPIFYSVEEVLRWANNSVGENQNTAA